VVQIRGGRQRLDRLIGEMIRQDSAQTARELFALDAARVPRRSARDELQFRVPRVTEPADLKHDALARFFVHTKDTPNQRLLAAPQMQQGRIALRAHLELRAFETREPLSVLPHFGRANGSECIESPSQFAGQFHARELWDRSAKRGSHFS
jgi:hypothetical protein